MDHSLCLMICSNFYHELKTIIESEGYENVILKSFPANCGECKRIHSDDIKMFIEKNKEQCSHTELICTEGCAAIDDTFEEIPNCSITKTKLCFNLLLNESVINRYLDDGYYLITPGWLMRWMVYFIDTWKFDKRMAQEFFGEFTSKLLLLDTGVYDDCINRMESLSEFVGRPFDVVNVSLDYMKHMIEKIILNFRLKVCQEEKSKGLAVRNRQLAEYSMVFDLFSRITNIGQEEKVIDSIFDLIKMIITPDKIVYLSLVDGEIDKIFSYPVQVDYNELIEAQKTGFNGRYMWTKSNKGFIMRIQYNNEEQGIICIDDILYDERKKYFLNTFLNMSSICGLAIFNARKYHELILTQQNLKLQKSYFQQLFKNSPESIIILDNDGKISNINNGFIELFQYSFEEIQGKNIEILVLDDKIEELFWVKDNILSGNFVKLETVRKRKDGEMLDVKILAYPIINEGKKVGTYVIYSDISEKKRREEKLKKLAFNDSLTGLSTRRVFIKKLEEEIRISDKNNNKLAVIFIDLNKFKQINDHLGHEVGDKLLIETAKRLKKHVRKNDTVARMGGDEFTLLLSDIDSAEAAIKTVKRILNSLRERCIIEGNAIDISASIGVSFYPKDGKDVDVLIKKADIAMYCVKKSGKCGFQLFEEIKS